MNLLGNFLVSMVICVPLVVLTSLIITSPSWLMVIGFWVFSFANYVAEKAFPVTQEKA